MEISNFELHISVRGFVEFLLRSGDIDNRFGGGAELNAMQEGSRIHRLLQGKMGPDYQAEVPLFYCVENEEYRLKLEGRADGIVDNDEGIMIDEIKGTYRNIEHMREPVPVHLAQAKCYAYMYAKDRDVEAVKIRMSYCNIESEQVKFFYDEVKFKELEKWFGKLLKEYDKWAKLKCRQYKVRQESIEQLQFPYAYRDGQKELAAQVYQTINQSKKLFLEAPTGVGKTITTIFPAVKAIGMGKADQLFYLTAKTITRTAPVEAFELLRSKGLVFRTVVITAKEKICPIGKKDCNPVACERAKGHYDRINKALYEVLTKEKTLSREQIEKYAEKHCVCPYELTLDATLFADGIICDYNYVFDNEARLQRFFSDSAKGNYIFLIDEAHNLLDRARDMYSSVLFKDKFSELKREIKKTILEENAKERGLFVKAYAEKIVKQLEKCNKVLLEMKRECDNSKVLYEIDDFVKPLMRVHTMMSEYLAERDPHAPSVVYDFMMDFFFDVMHFLETYEVMDDNYVVYDQIQEDGNFFIKLFCTNPAGNLRECMKYARSTILFSATFLPIQYYKKLLGGTPEDYEVYAKSIFDPKKRGIFIATDVTSKYTRRSREEYERIAKYIAGIISAKQGNYMVFFPSHAFMHEIYDIYIDNYASKNEECILQQENMTEEDRENFLALFDEPINITAFCVLGGIFSEGIDLKEDKLIGSIIVGTGLPQVCFERELLKNYFDENDENGFDYAYRFPGMNKVLQAAGRVIRTENDRGVIALLDERFIQDNYRKLFPVEWSGFMKTNINSIVNRVEEFW